MSVHRQKISLLPIEPHLYLDRHSIERVNSYKCLGVQVNGTLSWEVHVFEVVHKVASALAALRRLKQHTLATIYKSLILLPFNCCSEAVKNRFRLGAH